MQVVIAPEDLKDTRFSATDIIILSILKSKNGKMHKRDMKKHWSFSRATRDRALQRLVFLKQIKVTDGVIKIINN